MSCPYCGNLAEFISSKNFYGTDYGTNLYVCRQCDARVGTHGKGKTPLGTMANNQLRTLRKLCHKHFDPKWKYKGKARQQARRQAYAWLQDVMGLSPQEAHIGKFNEDQCRKLLKILLKKDDKNGIEFKRNGSRNTK
ncbi:hypothetical protein J5S49_13405 [Virgibacillus halodenitrificans]|uniref:zinc-finger-containing protein n=1 Tax=Virgibacillus halodenitrificans TaxID=1482 RepID=UPI001F3F1CA8|nr:zinc-finger-containing protein [Virgibacillus halodenitrificans]MCG1029288.1 hypothetical protein [Virgibacillus halodenitrificans]